MHNSEFEESLKYYQRSLRHFESAIGGQNTKVNQLYLALGELHFLQHEFKMSEEYIERALYSLYTGDSLTLFSISQLNPNLFIELNGAVQAYSWLGKIRRKQYQDENKIQYLIDALQDYKLGIKCLHYLRNSMLSEDAKIRVVEIGNSLFSDAMNLCYELYEISNDQKYILEAIQVSESSKSMVLRDAINHHKAKVFTGLPDSILVYESELRGEIAFMKKKLQGNLQDSIRRDYENRKFDLENQFSALISLLENTYPDYYAMKYQQNWLDIDDLLTKLNSQNARLLSYYLNSEYILILSVSSKGLIFKRLRRDDKFNQMLADYNNSIGNYDLIMNNPEKADNDFVTSSRYLYDVLVKDCIDLKSPETQLVIVPHNELNTISFESLLTTDVKQIQYKYYPYLLKSFAVLYEYAISLYDNKNELRPTNRENYAGFAPAYRGTVSTFNEGLGTRELKATNIPYAIEEVIEVAKIQNGNFWIENEATEGAFKLNAPKHNLIHLAMHGFIDDENSSNSKLLFSSIKDSIEDGVLHLDEIYNLSLNADMVVLSACESGSGTLKFGEGNISLSRAFNYAGCKSVVMSQWKVPDQPSKEIITQFFSELKTGETKANALRNAKLTYLDGLSEDLYAHPFYWSGFVVTGNDNPINSKEYRVIVLGILVATFIALIILLVIRRNQFTF